MSRSDEAPDAAGGRGSAPALLGQDPRFEGGKEEVLQVERRDYVDLAPTSRPRRASLRGFAPINTVLVDYIVRGTQPLWDERDVGLV